MKIVIIMKELTTDYNWSSFEILSINYLLLFKLLNHLDTSYF